MSQYYHFLDATPVIYVGGYHISIKELLAQFLLPTLMMEAAGSPKPLVAYIKLHTVAS
jgi:hypothetical protein